MVSGSEASALPLPGELSEASYRPSDCWGGQHLCFASLLDYSDASCPILASLEKVLKIVNVWGP
jgi:hypothetical protein